MKKAAITLIATLATGCASQSPEPINWSNYVVPTGENEYITDVQSNDKNDASSFALKAAYATCKPGKPVVSKRKITRAGLMGEKTADAYDTVRYAAAALGTLTPNLNNEEYSAEYRFTCVPET